MTDLKKAAQQALEALETCDAEHPSDGGRQWYDAALVEPAITALRAALALTEQEPLMQDGIEDRETRGLSKWLSTRLDDYRAWKPEQEPVAWLYRDHNGQLRLNEIQPRPYFAFEVYTHPPQRKPLTPEEMLALFDSHNVYGSKWVEFARAIEAAHGIGEK